MNNIMHETKIHGKLSFPFIVYRGNIPEYLHSYPLHWHDEMEIIYITEGTGIITAQASKYTLHSKDMMILPPQTLHSIEQAGNNKMEYFNILFSFSLLQNNTTDDCYQKYYLPFFDHSRIFPTLLTGSESLNQLLLPYVKDLIEHRKQGSSYELMVKSDLLAILHHLYQYSTPSNDIELSRRNTYDKVKKLLTYIQENYNNSIPIQQAADICGFSKSHFMKLFKDLTGTGFTQYLKDYRLEIAANQLIETNQKIIEISENTGFHNPSYFTRSFFQKYGVTPSDYRRSYLKSIPTDSEDDNPSSLPVVSDLS